MTRVFQEGYDFRFSVTTAIPVIMQDLMIRVFGRFVSIILRENHGETVFPTQNMLIYVSCLSWGVPHYV